jgi:hypothetical protein
MTQRNDSKTQLTLTAAAAAAVVAGWTNSPFHLQIASWRVLVVVAVADRGVAEVEQIRLLAVPKEERNAAADSVEVGNQTCLCAFSTSSATIAIADSHKRRKVRDHFQLSPSDCVSCVESFRPPT